MSIYNTALTSVRAVQVRGTNLQEVEEFMGGKDAYKRNLKINWGNGTVKVKGLYGWMTIPKALNGWIVQGFGHDLYVMSNETFRRLFEDVENKT